MGTTVTGRRHERWPAALKREMSRHAARGSIAGTAWSTKRYLNVGLLKDQQMRGAISA